MAKASAHGAGDCRFESCQGHTKSGISPRTMVRMRHTLSWQVKESVDVQHNRCWKNGMFWLHTWEPLPAKSAESRNGGLSSFMKLRG